ncbi:MAG TPA: PD-(D/E)XK nuclease family protein [Terriglobia bacterium]|nr:PD-(D/E)XK nuclease family protein [Terriglobia bacterium]
MSETDEVRLHTRFLHCLLDPKGCHDCGPLFLNLFFATLQEIPGVDHSDAAAVLQIPSTEHHWKVRKEVRCPPHGQIDLLFEQPGFKTAIENKVNAPELPRQLACYSEHLRKRNRDKTWLIYLTKDGKRSNTAEGAPYIRISYAKHILAWLEKCLRESYQMAPITHGLLQYRHVVRQITGKTLQPAAMKPIADFILANPEIIRFRKQLLEATDHACAVFFTRLADEIAKQLQNDFQVRSHDERRFGLDPNGALIISRPGLPFEICIENDLQVLGIGISGPFDKSPPSEEHKILFGKMYEELKEDVNASGYTTKNWPTGWRVLLDLTNDDAVAKTMENPLSQTVANICSDIRSYIELIEQVYGAAGRANPCIEK